MYGRLMFFVMELLREGKITNQTELTIEYTDGQNSIYPVKRDVWYSHKVQELCTLELNVLNYWIDDTNLLHIVVLPA